MNELGIRDSRLGQTGDPHFTPPARPLRPRAVVSLVAAVLLVGCATSGATPALSPTAQPVAATSLPPSNPPSNPPGPCGGPCSAGTHRSVRLQPALTYTVPEGWFGIADETQEYILKFGSAETDDGLFIFREPVAHSQQPDCADTADPTVGTSPKELTDWIASLPGLVATPPKAVTVGGLPGFTLDVRVAPTWTQTCPYSNGAPVAPLIRSTFPGSDLDWNVGGTGRMRIYVLDAGLGRRLWMDVETIDGNDFDQLAERSTPVIESFEFSVQ